MFVTCLISVVLSIQLLLVSAFDQLYGINCGGPEHNDSDGLHYEYGFHPDHQDLSWVAPIDIGNVPETDRIIYNHITNSPNYTRKFGYDLPLDGDGLYALILKFSFARSGEDKHVMTISLNDEIQLLTNVNQLHHCGGYGKSCDTYIYFCVANQTVYYEQQMVQLTDENKVKLNFHAVEGRAHMAGVVLLKGTIGERKNLVGSNTDKLLYFDPLKTQANCANDEKLNRIIVVSLLKELINLENKQLNALAKVQTRIRRLENSGVDVKFIENVTEEMDEENYVAHSFDS